LQDLGLSSPQSLQSQIPPQPKNRLPLNRLETSSRTTHFMPALDGNGFDTRKIAYFANPPGATVFFLGDNRTKRR
jgi:hypothetical protein